jgi:hypothetical protein
MGGIGGILVVGGVVAMAVLGQLQGQELRLGRVVLVPALLMVIGLEGLGHLGAMGPLDLLCITVSSAMGAAIGIGQGALMHLEERAGALWGRMPPRSLWLWALLIGSRLAMMLMASLLGARAATSLDCILLVLGVNRLAQAAVIFLRAEAAGLPAMAGGGRSRHGSAAFGGRRV